jgi:YD repeat-containing protein
MGWADTLIYDANDRIIKIHSVYNPRFATTFTYDEKGRISSKEQINIWKIHTDFTYNESNQLIEVHQIVDRLGDPEYSQQVTYNDFGYIYANTVTKNPYSFMDTPTSVFEYDNNKTPLYGLDPLIFSNDPAENNVVRITNTNDGSFVEWTIEYNDRGYPTKIISSDNTELITEYIYDCR